MYSDAVTSPRWITASIPDATDNAPLELRELGKHLSLCDGCRGRWFAIRCAADTVHDFVARRFVTSLLVVGMVVGLGALAL